MQLREFAERVLFATDLEGKLAPPPAGLVDDAPGPVLACPAAPGRPDALRLDRVRERPPELPSSASLGDEAERGRLLHFFANHELLATELMALVLLRFPDAPREFRAGVLRTLREEQMHTRLYLRRMAQCGVRFGDEPVNGFFWRMVAPMESPLDYVSRLSLTFEQANLDYARHFAAVFDASGDPATARILERIYRDEISHVGYGLQWFRRWKAEGRTDWDAFQAQLAHPISPARAKGGGVRFNRDGRRAAGIDPDFIARLEVYSASRGRTPDVFYFNADAELRLAGAGVPDSATDLCRDLALLAAPLARAEDILVVPDAPSTGFLQSLVRCGLELPELVPRRDLGDIAGRKLRALRPWAWTDDAARELAPLVPAVTTAVPGTVPAGLFSKALAAEWQHAVAAEAAGPEWHDLLGSASLAGEPAADANAVAMIAARAREAGYAAVVCKAPISTAGRERVVLPTGRPPDPGPSDQLDRLLASHGAVVVEPWLDRVFDFSIQFERPPGGPLRRLGAIVLENAPGGGFRSCTMPARWSKALPEPVIRAIHPPGAPRRGRLEQFLSEVLEPFLERRLAGFPFTGPLGIDALFHRAPDGRILLKPIVEINPRFTMGRVALELARHAAQHASTTLSILTLPQIRRRGFRTFGDLAASLAPPVDAAAPPRRLSSGTLPLNDPSTARRFLATVSFS